MSERDPRALAADIRALLDEAGALPEPDVAARERVRARVLGTLGLLAPVPAPAPVAPGPMPPASHLGWLKLAAGLFAVGAGGAGTYLALRRAPARPAPVVVVAAPAPTPAPVAAPVAPPVPVAAPMVFTPDETAAPAPRVHHHAAPPVDDLAAERALLEEARVALARNDPSRALVTVEQHARDFPRGRLVEERESLWVRALALDHEDEAARARADRFRRRWPHSIFLPAVDATLDAMP